MRRASALLALAVALAAALSSTAVPAAAASARARADIAAIAEDGHSAAAAQPTPDGVALVDLERDPPAIVALIDAPAGGAGPGTDAIWLARDANWLIVTAATRIDPHDPAKLAPDDRVSVIDLRGGMPRLTQQIAAGAGAAGVAVSPRGNLALVANRDAGTISVFAINDQRLTGIATVALGNPRSAPTAIGFLPDGATALVARAGDDRISRLRISGTKVTLDPQPIATGFAPRGLAIGRDGRFAAIAGGGPGGTGSVTLLDLSRHPPIAIATIATAGTPAALDWSPDGLILAVATAGGRAGAGRLRLFAFDGTRLNPVAETPTGGAPGSVAFARDGHTIVVGSLAERALDIFRWRAGRLTALPPLPIGAEPAAIAAPGR